MQESEKWKWSRSVGSDSSRPHGLQPTRLLRPWEFPGKSTRVGCHCLLQDSNIGSYKYNHKYLRNRIIVPKFQLHCREVEKNSNSSFSQRAFLLERQDILQRNKAARNSGKSSVRSQTTWILLPALSLTNFIILGKYLSLSQVFI